MTPKRSVSAEQMSKAFEEFNRRQIARTNPLAQYAHLKQNAFMTPIESLTLTARTQNALTRAGYDTVEQVLSARLSELKKVENLGKKSLAELRFRLEEEGHDVSGWERVAPGVDERMKAIEERLTAIEGASGDRELYEVMAAIKGLSLAQRAIVLSTIRSAIAVLRDGVKGL